MLALLALLAVAAALLLRVAVFVAGVGLPPRAAPAAGAGAGSRAAVQVQSLAQVLVLFPRWGPHRGAAAKLLVFPIRRLLFGRGSQLLPLLLLLFPVALRVPGRPLEQGALL